MNSVNKVILVGHLGKDPELQRTKSGRALAKLSLATNHYRRVGDDAFEKRTEWHDIVVWGRRAENCARYLSVGSQVFVEGRLERDEYTDREGNRKFWTQVVASDVRFLASRSRSEHARAA
jgi:single-strand DNA-binding protein